MHRNVTTLRSDRQQEVKVVITIVCAVKRNEI